jgi:2-C-methyl-D-erythritol 2,4-cyclodiphosphate synthase
MDASNLRIGQGYDVHRLVPGRRLILGGEEIDHPTGLEGHSDADVVLHALGDAILGACGLGDLGDHFPPGDARWKDASSIDLLSRIVTMAREEGFRVVNCDVAVIAEAPKLKPHRVKMKERIARVVGTEVDAVGIKATTNEKLGALGRAEGIAALAVVLVERVRS